MRDIPLHLLIYGNIPYTKFPFSTRFVGPFHGLSTLSISNDRERRETCGYRRFSIVFSSSIGFLEAPRLLERGMSFGLEFRVYRCSWNVEDLRYMLLILWRIHSFHRHVPSAVHSETGIFGLNKLFTFKIICSYLIREKNPSDSSQRKFIELHV